MRNFTWIIDRQVLDAHAIFQGRQLIKNTRQLKKKGKRLTYAYDSGNPNGYGGLLYSLEVSSSFFYMSLKDMNLLEIFVNFIFT